MKQKDLNNLKKSFSKKWRRRAILPSSPPTCITLLETGQITQTSFEEVKSLFEGKATTKFTPGKVVKKIDFNKIRVVKSHKDLPQVEDDSEKIQALIDEIHKDIRMEDNLSGLNRVSRRSSSVGELSESSG